MTAPETYYDVATRRLDEQVDRIGSLDTKAVVVLGAASALLPVFGVLVTAFDRSPSDWVTALYAASFALYLVMLFLGFRGIRVRGYSFRPDLDTLREHVHAHDEVTIRSWVAEECARSVETNEPKLREKALYVDLSLSVLFLVTLALSAAALVQMAS